METPNQLLERLDTMGEQRVRALLGKEHFIPQAMPMVTDWLVRKARERDEAARVPDPVERDDAELKRIRAAAVAASVAATKANRLALAALGAASVGLLISVLSLFAMALR